MKTWLGGALLGALALAACGRGGSGAGTGTVAASTPPPASLPGDCTKGVTIRLIGTNPGKVLSLALQPGFAGATCAPAAPACATLAGSEATSAMELTSDAVAYDLATFEYPPAGLPPDGGPATLTVYFSGGTATVAGTAGRLTFCGPAVHIPFDPRRVSRDRCSITILLDVGRSVVASGGTLAFVPQYRIYF